MASPNFPAIDQAFANLHVLRADVPLLRFLRTQQLATIKSSKGGTHGYP